MDEFIEIVQKHADAMATNNVMVPFGCDFTFANAQIWFKNIDKVCEFVCV